MCLLNKIGILCDIQFKVRQFYRVIVLQAQYYLALINSVSIM